MRPDIRDRRIRGNVDTRMAKVESGDYDAVVLAAAGLARLGWLDRASQVFDADEMLPAPGQGALAVQVRTDDPEAFAWRWPPTTRRREQRHRRARLRAAVGWRLPRRDRRARRRVARSASVCAASWPIRQAADLPRRDRLGRDDPGPPGLLLAERAHRAGRRCAAGGDGMSSPGKFISSVRARATRG